MPRQPITFHRLVSEILPRERLTDQRRLEIQRALQAGDTALLERAALDALQDLSRIGDLRADSKGLPPGQVRYHLPGGASLVVVGSAPRPAGPRRIEPGQTWRENAPSESLHALLRLHEELLTGDRLVYHSTSSLRRHRPQYRALIVSPHIRHTVAP